MKKKILISVLILTLVLSISLVTFPKVSAAEDTESSTYNTEDYNQYSQFYLYDDSLEYELLSMDVTHNVNGNKTNFIPIDYIGNSLYLSIESFAASMPSFYFNTCVSKTLIDYEYYVVPGFDEGFWICLKGFYINYNFLLGEQVGYNREHYLPLKANDYLSWYDWDGNEIGDFRFFSGFDMADVSNGYIPSPKNNSVTDFSQLQLDFIFEIDLVEWEGAACVQFIIEVVYPWLDEGGYQYLTTYIPIVDLTEITDIDYLLFLDDYNTQGSTNLVPIYNPMAVFAWKNLKYSGQYDKGFREGRTKGWEEGYVKGQNSLNIDFTSWISSAVGGFLGFQIIPGLSILSVLSFIISLGLLFLILRFFSGG